MGLLSLFRPAPPPPQRRKAQRGYAAAANSRLTASWAASSRTPEAELRPALRNLRNRARNLAINNDHAARFLALVEANVVGPTGVGLQVRARDASGELDGYANTTIERAWAEWGRAESCTTDGMSSWRDVQRLVMRSVARDGEVLVRLVRGPAARNDLGLALQVLEADYLDEEHNKRLAGGARIVMGVEIDEWKRPVAYHLANEHPGADMFSMQASRRYVREAAENVLHLFVAHRPAQPRGAPWLAPSMTRLYQLGEYAQAELVAARAAASTMGFFTSPTGDEVTGDDEDAQGRLIHEASPGTFEQLPAGVSLETWKPEHPNTDYGRFVQTELRAVAAGLGVSYHSLANDLTAVNYSSIRAGNLEDQAAWRCHQRWLIEHLCRPVFEAWLEAWLTSGLTNLPISKFGKFNQPIWSPRGWQWVDPLKEVQANALAVAEGFKSRSEVAAEMGRDYEEILEALAREKELEAAVGLSLGQQMKEQFDAAGLEDE